MRRFAAFAVILVCGTMTAGDGQLNPIAPADAKDHVGQSITVEMTVKAAKKSAKRKTVFLDSLEDFSDADNLGIAIDEDGEKEVSAKFSTTDLPAFFLNKSIRVSGTVARRDERTYIDVSRAAQVELSPAQ